MKNVLTWSGTCDAVCLLQTLVRLLGNRCLLLSCEFCASGSVISVLGLPPSLRLQWLLSRSVWLQLFPLCVIHILNKKLIFLFLK